MKFNLNYTPPKPAFEINHRQKSLLAGSCFAENIGSILSEHKFETLTNPSGILFNPLSIYNSLIGCIERKSFDKNYVVKKGFEYFSFLHHSSVSETSEEKLAEKIDHHNRATFKYLRDCDFLIITFGTAFYYQNIALDACVANCHKQPAAHFEKKLLTVDKIVALYTELIKNILEINPGLKIIFTVSPVKYLKEGVIENNISKATLLLSVNTLVQNNKSCFYFPAYEFVTDDLRDYRFYKEDMAHPNEQAIKYIWEKFSEQYFNIQTKLLNEKINRLNTAKKHKTLHNNSEESIKFQKHIDDLIAEIKAFEPRLNF